MKTDKLSEKKTMKKNADRLIRLLIPALIAIALTSTSSARDNDSALSAARLSSADVAGLQAPGKILIDVWGIPARS
jgi:penicillin G amidase